MIWLRQSTAREIKLGPFTDSVDGDTEEESLTITSAEVLIQKAEGDWAAKNEGTSLVHESNGWYRCLFDTTDTNTLGELRVKVHESGSLYVWREFMVVPANVWDAFFGADALQVHAVEIANNLITTAAINDGAFTAAKFASAFLTAAKLATDLDTYQAKVELIDDNGATFDRYIVTWFHNSQPITTGITSPTIQVIKIADGSDLVAEAAMTEIASTGMYKYEEGTDRIVNGVGYIAVVTATIGGSERIYNQPIGRDSS